MNETITREILPKKAKFYYIAYPFAGVFNRNDIFRKIDYWKYILVNYYNAQPEKTVMLTASPKDPNYFPILFAIFELGMCLVINDYDVPNELEIMDPKTKLLTPIDLIILPAKRNLSEFKFNYWKELSRDFMGMEENKNQQIQDKEEYTRISKLRPNKNNILMTCTSSGTTGKPKIVKHTHQFMYHVSKRNSSFFNGNVLHSFNLMHGSSIAVFTLPSLMSKNVDYHYTIDPLPSNNRLHLYRLPGIAKEYRVNHLFFPHVGEFNHFLNVLNESREKTDNLNCYILSYINKEIRNNINNLKNDSNLNIFSIFGSNETSGPVLISKYSKNQKSNLEFNQFYKFDDFYDIWVDKENVLNVSLPIYEKTIKTNDVFELKDNIYTHKGRKDILRLNLNNEEIVIEQNWLHNLCGSYSIDGKLIADPIYNEIYFVLFSSSEKDKTFEFVQNEIKKQYPSVDINKFDVLDREKFTSGIKLDHERLREYFRQKVDYVKGQK